MGSPGEELRNKLDQVIEAYKDLRRHEIDAEMLPGVEQVDDVLVVIEDAVGTPQYEEEARADAEEWRETLRPRLDPFAEAEWEPVDNVLDSLDEAQVLLRQNSGVEQATDPGAVIRQYIAGWDSPAGHAFRDRHLPHLENALRYQQEFVQGLMDIIKVHAAVVESAHSRALSMLERARLALREQAAQEAAEEREQLRRLVMDIITVSLAAASGEGPHKPALTALERVGEALASLEFEPEGGSNDIMRDLHSKFGQLRERTAEEQEQVRRSLNRLGDYLDGQWAEIFVPLPLEPVLGVGNREEGSVELPRPPVGSERHG